MFFSGLRTLTWIHLMVKNSSPLVIGILTVIHGRGGGGVFFLQSVLDFRLYILDMSIDISGSPKLHVRELIPLPSSLAVSHLKNHQFKQATGPSAGITTNWIIN